MDISATTIAMLLLSALLEVGGDYAIRKGLDRSSLLVAGGCVTLAAYGYLVTHVPWKFSRLLGVYVAVFALVSVGWGRLVEHDPVPPMMWVGVAIIAAGGLVVYVAGLPASAA